MNPQDLGFEKFSGYRKGQDKVISSILTEFTRGKKVVLAELPTGAGKTLIGMSVYGLSADRMIYLCTTKTLQDQFMRDFPNAKKLMGRNN